MGLSLKPQHLKRYKDVAVLLMKYGRSDLVKAAGLDPTLDDESPAATRRSRRRPSWRTISSAWVRRSSSWASSCRRAPTSCRPPIWRPSRGCRIASSPSPSRRSRASSPPSSACASRRRSPSSRPKPSPPRRSAQVHRAALRDGRPVAVKVQRPGIRERIAEDLEALDEIAEFLDSHTEVGRRYGFGSMIDEFRRTLMHELDYRQEAANLDAARDATSRTSSARRSRADRRLHDRARAHDGLRLGHEDHRAQPAGPARDRRRGARRAALPRVPGADPRRRLLPRRPAPRQRLPDRRRPDRAARPGHGRRASLPRCRSTCCSSFSPSARASSEEAAEVARRSARPARGLRRAGVPPPHRRPRRAPPGTPTCGSMEVGRLVLEIARIAARRGLRLPSELTMLGKTLLNLDQVDDARSRLRPQRGDPPQRGEIMRQQLLKTPLPGTFSAALLEPRNSSRSCPAG